MTKRLKRRKLQKFLKQQGQLLLGRTNNVGVMEILLSPLSFHSFFASHLSDQSWNIVPYKLAGTLLRIPLNNSVQQPIHNDKSNVLRKAPVKNSIYEPVHFALCKIHSSTFASTLSSQISASFPKPNSYCRTISFLPRLDPDTSTPDSTISIVKKQLI